ncbi:DNA-binding protein [Xanthomonas phage M29]|nr:DNA-binding protein [Xanthomonas phage M29]
MALEKPTFEKGAQVKASTVHSAEKEAGKIIEIRQGQKGHWYSVELHDGRTINTRAAKIELA